MRLTPSQISMLHLLGEPLPFCEPGGWTLKERIRAGHASLARQTGQDFGFDPQRWHDYLRETNAGGYRWSGMTKRIDRAASDPEWRRAVEELRGSEAEQESGASA